MKETEHIQERLYRDSRNYELFQTAHRYGYEYLSNIFERSVFPKEEALDNLDHFKEEMPEAPSPANKIIQLLHEFGSPATVATQGGRYFGFVTGSAVPGGLAAKTLATFWDQAPAMHVLSPIGATLETVVELWLKQLFKLPSSVVAGFVSGTSMANFCSLAAARYRQLLKLGWDLSTQGVFGAPKLRIIMGKHVHSTILKSVNLLGFGTNVIEWVDVDDQGRIRPDEIPQLDYRSILILQAGNVNSGAFDPFEVICKKAKEAGAWTHIDGAFGLWARAVPRLEHLTQGMEHANSWAVDGHKTLNTPYDSGIMLCDDSEALKSALHISGSYIVTSKERDGMFYTPEMSRRARIVELWATLKSLGKSGIDQMVWGMHQRALQFADELRSIKGFTIPNEVVFNQVLVQCDSEPLTQATMERVQALRECWAGGSIWQGKKTIRVSICSWATSEADISRSVRSFASALEWAKHITQNPVA